MKLFLSTVIFITVIFSHSFAQWSHQISGTSERLLSNHFINETTGWAAGDDGTIVKTSDGGNTWFSQSVSTLDDVHSIFFTDNLNGWIALYEFIPDRHGSIMHTTDGGDTWTTQFSISGATLFSVHFADINNGWTVGSNAVTYHTTNGGQVWFQQFPTSGYWLFSTFFLDGETGWLAGDALGGILKTTNGGTTWISQSIPTTNRMMSIYFLDQNNGWAVGAGGSTVRTTNGGNSWFLVPSGVSQELRSVRFVDTNEGWAVGLGGKVIHSTDGGASWTIQNSNTSNDLFGVSFVNNVQGWVAGENGTILVTNNGGVPVELVSFTADIDGYLVNLSWITATEINNFGFEIERNTSDDWEKIGFVNGNGTTTEMQYYSFTDDIRLVSNVDKIYYRLKQIDFDGTFEYSNVVEIDLVKPNSYSLQQNYPNPFNPSTMISFTIPEIGYATLDIYDVLGNKVKNLVDGNKSPGVYDVEFNAIDLPSGIYYYKLVTGDFVDVKKMILLK